MEDDQSTASWAVPTAHLLHLDTVRPVDATALDMLRIAFSRPREPRSMAYQEGLLACLRVRLEADAGGDCPYDEGSAERDAFFAGVEEARALVKPLNVAPNFRGPLIMTL